MIKLKKSKYTDFIENIIKTRGQWNVSKDEYFEMHHIVPRCLGGEGDNKNKSFKKYSTHPNCIWLKADEHYKAHELLTEVYPDNDSLLYAFWAICTIKTENQERRKINEEEFKKLKEKYASLDKTEINKKISEIAKKQFQEGKRKVWSEGLTKETDERLQNLSLKLSKERKGLNNPIHRIKDKEAFKKHRSQAQKLFYSNPENRLKQSERVKQLRRTTSPIWNKGLPGNTKGKIVIHKDNKNKFILKEDLEKYLKEGWILGGKPVKKTV